MRALLIALMTLAAAATQAAAVTVDKENAYRVEVVVFAIDMPELTGGELWTRETGQPARALPEEFLLPQGTSPSDSPMRAAAAALAQDPRFRVLAQAAWTQIAEARSTTKPVRLRGGNPLNPGELDGTLRFFMSRYLHLDIDLSYEDGSGATVAALPAADRPAEPLRYRIREQRRIKSQETHYFDHPKFGLLVRVTPLVSSR
jgi:hypothetical protein